MTTFTLRAAVSSSPEVVTASQQSCLKGPLGSAERLLVSCRSRTLNGLTTKPAKAWFSWILSNKRPGTASHCSVRICRKKNKVPAFFITWLYEFQTICHYGRVQEGVWVARGPTAAETVETVQKQRAKGDRNRLRQKEFLYLVQNGLQAKKFQTILGRKYNRKRQLRASIELKK